jgi:predicted dehydrogenase
MKKLRFGILSTAKIGVEKVIPAMQKGRFTQVAALASRSVDKAKAVAKRLGIPTAHGSYEALLADPNVDAIYNPLPNDLHVPWSIKALEAGKHVLCEKPIALSAADARTLVQAGRRLPKLKLMEAFMYRLHPQWKKARELVRAGRIGRLRTIQTFFSYFNEDPNNIRNIASAGGGGLMDIGCYPISLSRWIFDAEPIRAAGSVEIDPRFQVDRLTSAILDFGERGTATFTCSTSSTPFQQVNIVGTEARIELADVPFNAPPDRPCTIAVHRGGACERISFEVCDQYALQGDAFAAAVLNDTPVPTPIEDAVRNMEVIDAIFESGRRGGWAEVGRHP